MEKRQSFTAEFKHEAIRLLKTSGKPTAVVETTMKKVDRSQVRC
ncbi:MAG: hypothetical protein WBP11_01900 [Dokdonella sp.]